MKILLKKIFISLFLTASLFNFAFSGELALIVKQDGLKVFLDISEVQTKPLQGQDFRVVEWGEDLVNPKTGKSLGKEAVSLSTGRITQVEELYAIGQLDTNADVLNKEAQFRAILPASVTHSAFNEDGSALVKLAGDAAVLPVWKSQLLEGEVKAVASGDITGDGVSELALAFAEENAIKVYSLGADNKLKLAAEAPVSNLRKVISLDMADLRKSGRAQIYAVVYDENSQKFATYVYELKETALEQIDTINGIVKGIAPYNGKRELFIQKVNPMSPVVTFTTPAKLIYADGKYDTGDKVVFSKFESVFGFNMGDFRLDKKIQPVFVFGKKLRIQFQNKKNFIDTSDDMDFSTTPLRISYGRSVIRLPLSLALFNKSDGNTYVAAVENQAKLGMLSDTFGSYYKARLFFLKWTGNSLVKHSFADIEGVVYDIFQGSLGQYNNVIIVPFSGAGSSTVAVFSAS